MEKNSLSDWIEALLSPIGLGRYQRKNFKIQAIDRKLGTDFGGHIFQSDLGYSESEGNDYTPSPDYLLKLCKNRISKDDIIIDLGCGKGYAMYLMSKFPFKKIYGIEKSESLVRIAEKNISIFDAEKKCEVWTVDATQIYMKPDLWKRMEECNYVYIYNSFPFHVMCEVVREFETLCKEKNWKVTVWYISPTPECLELMKKSEFFSISGHYYQGESGGGVYEFLSKGSVGT